jgi:hypothetical protein
METMGRVAALLAIVSSATTVGLLAGCSSTQTVANANAGQNGGDGGGAGSNGGDNGAGGDAGADADPFAACNGIAISQSGTFDMDLTAAHVSGHVTLNGAKQTNVDGQVSFRDPKTNAVATASVDATGSYKTTLANGTYDVWFEPNGQGCSSTSTWPCVAHVLKSGVPISADGVLDVDVPTVKASGKVTLAGKAFPTNTQTGGLAFADTSSAPTGAGATLASSGYVSISTVGGGATYAATLVPGHYSIAYAAASTACNTTTPCTGGVVTQDVSISASGALDVDVPMVVVRGRVTLNGAALPAQQGLGSIFFSQGKVGAQGDGSGANSAGTTIDAAGTYAAALFPGAYDVGYSGDPNAISTSLMPRNAGVLVPQADLSHDGTLDLDVQSASVQGKVTANGMALGQANGNPGSIGFALSGASTPLVSTFAIASGAYRAVLIAGSYDVSFEGDSYGCSNGATPSMPCNRGKLKSITLAKGQAGALDLDVPTVTIHGKITVNGGSPSQSDVAQITFALSGTTGTTGGVASFQTDAKNTYNVALVPGTYDVGIGAGNCQDVASSLPCVGGVVKAGVTLTSSGALDLDVPTLTVSGKVTLAGQQVPQATDSRGSAFFSMKSGGAAESTPFSSTGPITYSLRLLPGNYVLGTQASTQLCATGDSPLPCHAVVVAGCP